MLNCIYQIFYVLIIMNKKEIIETENFALKSKLIGITTVTTNEVILVTASLTNVFFQKSVII